MNNEERNNQERSHFAAIALAQLLIPENFAGVIEAAKQEDMDVNQALAIGCVHLADALIAELNRTAVVKESLTTEPDADGWIPHRPGDPIPCDEGAMCYRKYRNGKTGISGIAGDYSWGEWGGGEHEIIAWKPA